MVIRGWIIMTVSGQGDRVEYETDTETELLETSNLLDTVSEFWFWW